MMKTTILRQLIILPLLAALMATLHACGAVAASKAAPAAFTAEYVLRQGASVRIAPAGATSDSTTAPILRLDRVNDSRCRAGVVCVWAGYISFSFTLLLPDGSVSNFVLSDKMPNGSPTATRNGLTFALTGFEPQEAPPKTEPAPDYQVSLKVSNINSP